MSALDAFLKMAANSKPPADLAAVCKPIAEAVQAVSEFRDANRRSKQFNHLSAISEGISFIGWVSVPMKPVPYLDECANSAEFYVNRVIKEFKESDPVQVQWARTWMGAIKAMVEYVTDYHRAGVTWNVKSGAAASAPASSKPAAAAPAAAKPAVAAAAPAAAAAAKSGLFAELSKGTGITSGLKKVDKSQMTHKNPELRATSVVPAAAAPAASAVAKKAAPVADKPPVLELQGKKWAIEYQKDNKSIVLDDVNQKQTVYVYKCTGSVIQVKGKVNQITLDSCKKTAIVFDGCMASCEIINCQSVQVQVLKKCPTVSIDKTDGAQVFLSKDSLDAEIMCAKSSEMNVSMPKGDDGEFSENSLPEMMKTVVKNGKLVTEIIEHLG